MDPRLGGEFDEDEARRALMMGLACSSPEPALRPRMRGVVQVLGRGVGEIPAAYGAMPAVEYLSLNGNNL